MFLEGEAHNSWHAPAKRLQIANWDWEESGKRNHRFVETSMVNWMYGGSEGTGEPKLRDELFGTPCNMCLPRNPIFRANDYYHEDLWGPGHQCSGGAEDWAGASINDDLPTVLDGTAVSPFDFCFYSCAYNFYCTSFQVSKEAGRCLMFHHDNISAVASPYADEECHVMRVKDAAYSPKGRLKKHYAAQRTHPGTFFISTLDSLWADTVWGCPPRGVYGEVVKEALDLLQHAKPELPVPAFPEHVIIPCCGEFVTTRSAIQAWPVYIWEILLMWISMVPPDIQVGRLLCKAQNPEGTPCGKIIGNGKFFDGEGYDKAVGMEFVFPLLLSHELIHEDVNNATIFLDPDVCQIYGNSTTINSLCQGHGAAAAAKNCLWTRKEFRTEKC